MFTGIVQGVGEILAINDKDHFRTYWVKLPQAMSRGLQLGASIANNGCCLTITQIENDTVSFDLMKETLRLTNLGQLKVGDKVNLERAARFGDEIGGHSMSGHIACTAEIKQIIETPNNYQIVFTLPDAFMKYVLHKGFIGIDGISLTVGEVSDNRFNVYLIPETLNRTTLGHKSIGQCVNIEIDPQTQAVVDTVERILATKGH